MPTIRSLAVLGSFVVLAPPVQATEAVIAPVLEIVEPVSCSGLSPFYIVPGATFRWRAVPGTTNPTETRYAFLNMEEFGSFSEAIDYLRSNPNAPEWSEWETYAPPDLGSSWTVPAIDFAYYVFAVQGRDSDGNIQVLLEEPRNVRRCVYFWSDGPPLFVTSPHFDTVGRDETAFELPIKIELVTETPVTFCWTSNACHYGGTISYRYAWDLTDPNDESQWAMPFTPYVSSQACSPEMSIVPYGTHVFHLEAMDSQGNKSSVTIQVTWRHEQGGAQPWSRSYGDPTVQHSKDVAVDDAGNVVIVGEFDGRISFGGGAFSGSSDVFVAKLNRFGTHLWSKAIQGVGEQFIRGVGVDALGNVYIAGQFYNTIVIGSTTLTSVGNADVFMAVFDPHGTNFVARRFGGGGEDRVSAMDVDNNGNIVLAGDIIAGTASLGGAVLPAGMYVAKYDGFGTHSWSHSLGGDIGSTAFVRTDNGGSVILGGHFFGSVDFGGGALASQGIDVFLAKLNPDGSHAWSHHWGDAQDQYGAAVALGPGGDIALAGSFYGTINLGAGPLTSNGVTDVFVAKFDTHGFAQWSRRFGDASAQAATGAAVGPTGNLVVTGYYSGTLDFGGGPLTSAGAADFFVAKLDDFGNHIRSQRYGDGANQLAIKVDVDETDDAVVFGEFNGSVDFGTGLLTSAGSQDVVVARLDSSIPVDVQPNPIAQARLTNYPNPFNPSTTIVYEMPSAGDVMLAIYDVRGALVRTLAQGNKPAGQHITRWDGRDERGRAVASGVYFARLELGRATVTRKLTLLK